MIVITCPECNHPVSEHNHYICLVPEPQDCPCNKGAEEIMLEFIEKLALAAKQAANVITKQGSLDEIAKHIVLDELNEALIGIEIVEETAGG